MNKPDHKGMFSGIADARPVDFICADERRSDLEKINKNNNVVHVEALLRTMMGKVQKNELHHTYGEIYGVKAH